MVCNREGLYNSVISDCKCFHPPFFRAGNYFLYANHAVHLTHDCMQMQLYTLFECIVHPFFPEIICRLDSCHRRKCNLFAVTVIDRYTFYNIEFALLQFVKQWFLVVRRYKQLKHNGIRKIRNCTCDNKLPASEFLFLNLNYLSMNTAFPGSLFQCFNLYNIRIAVSSIKYIRILCLLLTIISIISFSGKFTVRSGTCTIGLSCCSHRFRTGHSRLYRLRCHRLCIHLCFYLLCFTLRSLFIFCIFLFFRSIRSSL